MQSTSFKFLAGFARGDLLHYFGALGARGIEAVGKFGLYMLAARLMGGHESGLFFLCLTWVNLASTVSRMGLERAMARHIAAELAFARANAARRALVVGLGWTALASLAAAAVTFVVARPAAELLFHQADLARPLQLAALIVPPQALAFAVGFALIGLDRGLSAQLVQSALPPVLSLAALVIGAAHVDSLLVAYACSYAACSCIGGTFLLREWRRTLGARPVPDAAIQESLPSIWATARPFLAIEMVQVSLASLPVLVLGAFADARVVSAFSIISRLTMLISTILLSIAMIAAPSFARHHRRHEDAEFRRVNRQARLLAMATCLPCLALMIAFSRLLPVILGHEFSIASNALLVLTIGQTVNTFLPNQDMLLAMTGHGNTLLWINLQQLVVCCVLAAALIPPFGLMGAAWLSTISLAQGRVGFALAARRVLPELSASGRIT